MSLKKLITYTGDCGPEISEFEIESAKLASMVKEFIDEYSDDFDAEDGRMLKVSKDKVKGLSPIGSHPLSKADIIECLGDALTELDVDDEYIESIKENSLEIIDDLLTVKWTTVSRNLGALDIESNIENIDDELLAIINDKMETALSRNEAMKNDSFKEAIQEYLPDEMPYLMLVVEFTLDEGKDSIKVQIKNGN